MQVLFCSTSYPRDDHDWKGRFISNIVNALNQREDIQLALWAPPGDRPPTVTDATTPIESDWLQSLLEDGGIAHILQSKGILAAGRALRLLQHLRRAYKRGSSADLIHVNWIQNAIPLWGIKKPAVISVLGSDFGLLNNSVLLPLLRAVFRQRRCILAPNAGWMAPRLEALFGKVAEVRPIPYGVEDRWFKIKRTKVLGEPFKWLAVFRVTKEKIGPLFDWGQKIFKPPHEIHLIGPKQENLHLPDWIHYHGPASADELCENWFQKATGLITLSQHDEGRPQVILEAMAAGLPVVASDIPAHLDVIRHQQTGWIAKSAFEFREAITSLCDFEANQSIGNEARRWVIDNIGTWHDCADRYIHAYQDLLEVNK
jgi:glycosyltransferase involved in cell wall biosynthesis